MYSHPRTNGAYCLYYDLNCIEESVRNTFWSISK